MTTLDKFLEALKSMDKTMRSDNAAGHQWKYTNSKKRNKTFAAARKNKNYVTNCATGVDWGLLIAGVPPSAQSWYGAPGEIVWIGAKAQANAKKHFNIIHIDGKKTVQQLYKDHELCEGDILTYTNLSHTNAYIGNGKSFDSGHAYCTGSGEMAPFKKWTGNLAHKTAKVEYILRLKDRDQYRVQAGAYYKQEEANKQIAKLNKLGFKTIVRHEDGMIKLQTGLFDGRENAEKQVKDLAKKGIPAFVQVI